MNHHTPTSTYTYTLNTNPTQSNIITNPTFYYHNRTPKKSETPITQPIPSYFAHSSPSNPNLLNVKPIIPQNKYSPQHFQNKQVDWKNSQINTAKSMVFISNQKQTPQNNPTKKLFTGIKKLSQMARPVYDIDDNDDFGMKKMNDIPKNSININDNKAQNSKRYGNLLHLESISSKNLQFKESPIGSSTILNPNQQNINLYKSFIPQASNNKNSDEKKTGGLEFLLKFKKEQQQKKQKQTLQLLDGKQQFKNQKNFNRNANYGNFFHPSQINNHKISHQHSVPDLRNLQKNFTYHHHDPVNVYVLQKNDAPSKNTQKQFQCPYQKTQFKNNFNFQNSTNKQSSLLQQLDGQTLCTKSISDKNYRQVPVKAIHSQSQIPSSLNSKYSPISKVSFAKKETKFDSDTIGKISEKTPVKSKLNIPSFFKNRESKMVSDAKTIDTTQSPCSIKSKFQSREQSRTFMKSTLSDDEDDEGLDESFDYQLDSSLQALKQWSLDDFELGDKLGKGAFGDVYIARQKNLGFFCVLKKMSKKRIKDLKRQQQVIRQLKIQLYLNNKHLTSLYGYFHDTNYIYLVMEYLPDGNLAQLKRHKRTSEKQTASIIYQICQGLSFMHRRQIIHRDIKPQNIFVNEGCVKLGDFGCSIETDCMRKTVVSCLQYSSPEQLSGESYNEKIDVWGVGILAYELLVGRSPFQKEIMNMTNQQLKFDNIVFPQQLKISQQAKDFIKCLLNTDPIERIDIEEALQHKFIKMNSQAQQEDATIKL